MVKTNDKQDKEINISTHKHPMKRAHSKIGCASVAFVN